MPLWTRYARTHKVVVCECTRRGWDGGQKGTQEMHKSPRFRCGTHCKLSMHGGEHLPTTSCTSLASISLSTVKVHDGDHESTATVNELSEKVTQSSSFQTLMAKCQKEKKTLHKEANKEIENTYLRLTQGPVREGSGATAAGLDAT